jgi:hypothetical protein
MNLPTITFDDATFQLDQWWATLTWRQGEELKTDEFIFWVLEDEEVVKFEVTPLKPKRKPFGTAKLNRKSGMLMSISPMDVVKPLLINLANNMARKDKLVIAAANTPTFFEPSTGLDIKRMALQENGYIPVLNAKGISRQEPPVNAIAILDRHNGFLIGQAREATAATEQAQGIGAGGADTATESRILDSSSGMRFQYNSEMVLNGIFGTMARNFYLLYKQFPGEMNMVVRESGVDGKAVKVEPEDLAGDYEFRAIPPQSLNNRMNKFRLLEEMLMKLMQAQGMSPALFTTKDGQQKQLMPFEFLTEQMLPLIEIPGNNLFQNMKVPPQMLMNPMQNPNAMKVAPAGPVGNEATPMGVSAE